jgi:hypothetical protein
MVFGVLEVLHCTLVSLYMVHNEAESRARFFSHEKTAGSPHCSLSPVKDSGLSQKEFDDVPQPIIARIHYWLKAHATGECDGNLGPRLGE